MLISLLIASQLIRFVVSMESIARIKPQQLLTETQSPDGQYTVAFYLNDGGATTAHAVLGQVTDNSNGKKKNIYWQYREDSVNLKWLDAQVLEINGKKLDIQHDTYDYRKDEE